MTDDKQNLKTEVVQRLDDDNNQSRAIDLLRKSRADDFLSYLSDRHYEFRGHVISMLESDLAEEVGRMGLMPDTSRARKSINKIEALEHVPSIIWDINQGEENAQPLNNQDIIEIVNDLEKSS